MKTPDKAFQSRPFPVEKVSHIKWADLMSSSHCGESLREPFGP